MMLTGPILLQLVVILLAVQLFGYLCKFIGQPQVRLPRPDELPR